MKTIALLCLAVLASCATPTPKWAEFQPLDEPGSREPTVEELHRKNLSWITDNPCYR